MKPRKFKLIQDYPHSPKLGKIIYIDSETGQGYWDEGLKDWSSYHISTLLNCPKNWQEITEIPILVTEDGKELFEGDSCTEVIGYKINYTHNIKLSDKLYSNVIYFSTKELAKKWIEENKPKWSNKDMIDFAEKWEHEKYLFDSDIKKALKLREYDSKKKKD